MELQDLYGSTTTARESGMLFPSQSEEVWYWVSLILTRPGAVMVLSQHAAGGQAGHGAGVLGLAGPVGLVQGWPEV